MIRVIASTAGLDEAAVDARLCAAELYVSIEPLVVGSRLSNAPSVGVPLGQLHATYLITY